MTEMEKYEQLSSWMKIRTDFNFFFWQKKNPQRSWAWLVDEGGENVLQEVQPGGAKTLL